MSQKGKAMGIVLTFAALGTAIGPTIGGILTQFLSWNWIFFINVPIGIIGVVLAVWLIPALPTQSHRFDIIGVALSGVGLFLIVFGLQEGQMQEWQPWIWAVIACGIGAMAVFVYWQSVNRHEPLIPLEMFRDRNFTLANVGIAVIAFAVTAMLLPVMFYAQTVYGLTPTRAALLIAPTAVASGVLAPFVGRLVDRSHPRPIIGFGFSTLAIGLLWLSIDMKPSTPFWRLMLAMCAVGVGMAFIWAPLAATATRNLPMRLAGAGSGVYYTNRQIGSVLGSASMAAFMSSRVTAEMPAMPAGAAPRGESDVMHLPAFLHEPFATAMSQSLLLPAFIALLGVAAAFFLVGGSTKSEPDLS